MKKILVLFVMVLLSVTLFVPSFAGADVVIVSDETTDVVATSDNGILADPNPAVEAWVHPNWGSIDHAFSDAAKWIWATEYVTHPVAGEVVFFEKTFCLETEPPYNAAIWITCDNGYELYVNDTLIGSDGVAGAWTNDNAAALQLGEPENNSGNGVHGEVSYWSSVEGYVISDYLQVGKNTIRVRAANEHMANGTQTSNPAGLIFEVAMCDAEPVPCLPELSTVLLFSLGILALGAVVWMRRGKQLQAVDA